MLQLIKDKENWLNIWKLTNPIMVGYVSLSMAFGLLYTELDTHWVWAVIMSLFVYAGSQLLIIPLILAKASLFEISIISFLVNLRHIFYGFSLISKFSKIGFLKRNYLIFGITDETYSLITTKEMDENQIFLTILFCHFYWVAGTTIGAYIGHLITYDLRFLSFSLIALFIILTVEQITNLDSIMPFLIANIICLTSLLLSPQYMLIISLFFALIYLGIEYYAKR
jgi:4-azaleucine resistance transporter AzlC